MFRCCLPCRGGSAAPATSPPNSPVPSDELNNLQSDIQTGTVSSSAEVEPTSPLSNQLDFLTINQQIITANNTAVTTSLPITTASTTAVNTSTSSSSSSTSSSSSSSSSTPSSRLCQPQTSPLPHIEEEEEGGESNHQQQQLTRTGSSRGDIDYSSSPSPRNKHKNRKYLKGWNRTVPLVTSIETLTQSSSSVGASGGASAGGSLASSINNTSLVSSNLQSSGLLLPKMQAEQGSIGDLQKYHSRYLKNRRHTLANVR